MKYFLLPFLTLLSLSACQTRDIQIIAPVQDPLKPIELAAAQDFSLTVEHAAGPVTLNGEEIRKAVDCLTVRYNFSGLKNLSHEVAQIYNTAMQAEARQRDLLLQSSVVPIIWAIQEQKRPNGVPESEGFKLEALENCLKTTR